MFEEWSGWEQSIDLQDGGMCERTLTADGDGSACHGRHELTQSTCNKSSIDNTINEQQRRMMNGYTYRTMTTLPVLSPSPPGCCTECVQSITTGAPYPDQPLFGAARRSTSFVRYLSHCHQITKIHYQISVSYSIDGMVWLVDWTWLMCWNRNSDRYQTIVLVHRGKCLDCRILAPFVLVYMEHKETKVIYKNRIISDQETYLVGCMNHCFGACKLALFNVDHFASLSTRHNDSQSQQSIIASHRIVVDHQPRLPQPIDRFDDIKTPEFVNCTRPTHCELK